MIEDVINRLQGVKSTGQNRWIAKCPSHQDKSPSLALSQDADGKVLINCFAGCGTYEILQAVGLDWDAVFPEKMLTPAKPKKARIYATEGLQLLRLETQIVTLGGSRLQRGEKLNDEDYARFLKAMERITRVHEACGL